MTAEGRRWRWAAVGTLAVLAALLAWWERPGAPRPAAEPATAPAVEPRLTSQATLSAGVVQLMVTGNTALAEGSGAAARQARAAFEQATQRDERYAPAHAGLAQALVQLAASGAERAGTVLPSAIAHCDRAIELDPTLALAWQSLAQAEVQWTRDWPRAEMHYRRAISLAPNAAEPVLHLAELLAATNRAEPALSEIEAILGATRTSAAAQETLGRIHRFTGQGAAAMRHFDQAVALEPGRVSALAWRAATLAERGNRDEALAVARALDARAGPTWVSGYVHALAGRRAEALQVLEAMARQAGSAYVPAIQFAYLSAALGEKTPALDWIETAVREHSPWIEMLAVDPVLEPLGGDRRFSGALGALKLDGDR